MFNDILIGNKENQLAIFSNESVTCEKLNRLQPRRDLFLQVYLHRTSTEIRNERKIILGEHRGGVRISKPDPEPDILHFLIPTSPRPRRGRGRGRGSGFPAGPY